ncbi:hypothetical protein VTN02DRAFT_5166 [Thermoascus thermophilus]
MSTFANGYQFSPRSIFRRCAQCPATMPPCPPCASDETCTMTSRSCDTCGTMTCVKLSTVGGGNYDSQPQSEGPDGGAIAGGVVGGIAFVGIVTFLVWWFFIRKKRKAYAQQQQEFEKRSTSQGVQSRKSVASIASTVLTRASNVIQIAYIPGVTNRSPPNTPGMLVPPVPPLPGASPDQHFFMPGDLRDSSFSGLSDGRHSLTPSLARSSVATTAFVSPMPAQQAMRGKAAMVSVRSGNNTPAVKVTAPDAPAVPAITEAQLNKAGISNSSIVARTVTAKPVSVHFKKSKREAPTASDVPAAPAAAKTRDLPESQAESTASHSRARQLDSDSSSKLDDSSSGEEDEEDLQERSRKSGAPTLIEDSPSITQSPFADSQATEEDSGVSSARSSTDGRRMSTHRHRSSRGTNRLLEEAVSNAAAKQSGHQRQDSRHSTASSRRGPSPFDDSNEIKQ